MMKKTLFFLLLTFVVFSTKAQEWGNSIQQVRNIESGLMCISINNDTIVYGKQEDSGDGLVTTTFYSFENNRLFEKALMLEDSGQGGWLRDLYDETCNKAKLSCYKSSIELNHSVFWMQDYVLDLMFIYDKGKYVLYITYMEN